MEIIIIMTIIILKTTISLSLNLHQKHQKNLKTTVCDNF
jgi:hypothetical protein